MSKMQSLQQALNSNANRKAVAPAPEAKPKASNFNTSAPKSTAKAKTPKQPSREGKEFTGAWLNSDFSASLRLVQLRRRRDEHGKKIYLDDLMAEALNDLFRKYDVPTVRHD